MTNFCIYHSGKRCILNLYGGRPSQFVCENRCSKRRVPQFSDLLNFKSTPKSQQSISQTQWWKQLWEEWHTKMNPDQAWLDQFVSRVQCGECRTSFAALVKANPPDFDNWFPYSVKMHNFVNRKLNRSEFSLADAETRWLVGNIDIYSDKSTWPREWWKLERAQKAYREDLARVMVPAFPGGKGRGIVIAGGGKFFPSTYITIRVLREVGCTLPIQIWYLGRNQESQIWMRKSVIQYNVEWVDADAIRLEHDARILNGWELKPFAIRWCPFAEVMSLDSDCYPIRDPTYLFDDPSYQESGALFFPDAASEDLPGWQKKRDLPDPWTVFGMLSRHEPAIESGQLIIDRQRCWGELAITAWMNDHSDYTYKIVYGDKETFHLAWRYCGSNYALPAKRWRWDRHTMVQHDMQGNEIFLHRCHAKWTLGDDDARSMGFLTTQDGPSHRNDALPMEAFCWQALAELNGIYNLLKDEKCVKIES